MKNYILVLALVLACLALNVLSELIVTRRGNNAMWTEFKDYHNKVYTPQEDAMRRQVWHSHLKDMFHHNMKFSANKVPYSIGLNEYSDMTHEEFTKHMTGLDNEKNCQHASLIYKPPAKPKLPDSVDWREHGYVTKVMNQGKCGACWAFCTAASLEGQHKRKTGQLVKLSEQHLIDCTHPQGNNGCKGGQMCRALEYATDINGVATEEAYPFTGLRSDGKCKYSNGTAGSPVGGYLEVPYGDENALKIAVGLLGPIAAGLDGNTPYFRHYKTGIFHDKTCRNNTLTHALTVVGYGSENGVDYWLVKNSWGTNWGENGFGKMRRNHHNHCGLASRALFPVLEKRKDGSPKLTGPAAH